MTREIRTVVSSLAATAAALLMAVGVTGFARPVVAQDEESVTVELAEQEGSGVSGTAVVTPEGDDQTRVVIEATGVEEGGGEAHMFANATCENHRGVAEFFDLDPLDAEGKSDTVVDLPFSTATNGDYWVHIHAPADAGGGGLACGNVKAAGAPAAGGTTTGTTTAPQTGVGATAGGGGDDSLLLAALAAGSVLVAFVLLRRVNRGPSATSD